MAVATGRSGSQPAKGWVETRSGKCYSCPALSHLLRLLLTVGLFGGTLPGLAQMARASGNETLFRRQAPSGPVVIKLRPAKPAPGQKATVLLDFGSEPTLAPATELSISVAATAGDAVGDPS